MGTKAIVVDLSGGGTVIVREPLTKSTAAVLNAMPSLLRIKVGLKDGLCDDGTVVPTHFGEDVMTTVYPLVDKTCSISSGKFKSLPLGDKTGILYAMLTLLRMPLK